MVNKKHKLKERTCDRCKEKYEGYKMLFCDCPECFGKFLMITSIYGRHLCKKCRKAVNFPWSKKEFRKLEKEERV